MKAFFKFSTIALLLIILISSVLFISLGNSIYSGKNASLKVVNASGQNIRTATITLAGKSCSVRKLANNGEINCLFENLSEGSYSVTITLQNNTTIAKPSIGYVTGGMNFNHTITINKTGEVSLETDPNT